VIDVDQSLKGEAVVMTLSRIAISRGVPQTINVTRLKLGEPIIMIVTLTSHWDGTHRLNSLVRHVILQD
jgi:hypothetical protein